MNPDFEILADDKDVTYNIRSRLLSLTLTDETGSTSDTLKLSIVDSPDLAMPRKEVRLTISIGYRGKLIRKGTFTVDEVNLSYPPPQMEIGAKGAKLASSFRSPKTRSWHEKKIGKIVSTIAVEHGLTAKISETLSDIFIAHEDQTEESDSSFLNRLAKIHDAAVKPNDNLLLITSKAEGKSASGKLLPSFILSQQDITSWRGSLPDRDSYHSCAASWVDKENGKEKTVQTGDEKPQYKIRKKFESEVDALKAAHDTLKERQRRNASFSIEMPGNAELSAGCTVITTDLREGLNATWAIKKVTHTISPSGFKSSLELEPKKE